MIARLILIVLLSTFLAAGIEALGTASRANAQETDGAEVRLGVRAFGSRSVAVGLQYRVSGAWRSATPSRNILPASAISDRWYTTSAVNIEVLQARAEIGLLNRVWTDDAGPEQFTLTLGDTRYRARCGRLFFSLSGNELELQTGSRDCQDIVTVAPPELAEPTDVGTQVLRVAARPLSEGGIELGLQRLVGGRWETMRQPERPLITGALSDTWRFTSAFNLPALPPQVFGELRRGASITTRGGDFDLEVDGRHYRTRCGLLQLSILGEHILVDTAADQCHETAPLLTICPTSDCDVQQNAAYAWESRQVADSLFQIDLNRWEAQWVVNAIVADFFPRSSPPTVVFSGEQAHGHATRDEITLGTEVRNLGALIHELAHAIVNHATVRDVGHGGAFTAMLLHLWERYLPIADIEAARDDARRHGVTVASRPPVRARYSQANRTIGELFCNQRSQARWPDFCAAATGSMLKSLNAELQGLYVGWGEDDDRSWAAYSRSDTGVFRSYVVIDATIPQTGNEARLSFNCEDGALEVDIYWQVADDLDWTVLYRINDGPVQSEEWRSGWGTWGETEYKWTGREDAADLIAQLAWAAQSNGSFTAQAHQRNNPDHRYTATWHLHTLFNTPVQPNLTHCGR